MIVDGVRLPEIDIAGKEYPFFMGMLTLVMLMEETGLKKNEVIKKISEFENVAKGGDFGPEDIRFFVTFIWCCHKSAVEIAGKEPMFTKGNLWLMIENIDKGDFMEKLADGVEKNPKKPQAQ